MYFIVKLPLILLQFILINRVWAATEVEVDKPSIDYLTVDYLSVEQSVWKAIESHADRRVQLSTVQKEHERFFNSDFGETGNIIEDGADKDRKDATFEVANCLKELSYTFSRSVLYSSSSSPNQIVNELAQDVRDTRHILNVGERCSSVLADHARSATFWDKQKVLLCFLNCLCQNKIKNLFLFRFAGRLSL